MSNLQSGLAVPSESVRTREGFLRCGRSWPQHAPIIHTRGAQPGCRGNSQSLASHRLKKSFQIRGGHLVFRTRVTSRCKHETCGVGRECEWRLGSSLGMAMAGSCTSDVGVVYAWIVHSLRHCVVRWTTVYSRSIHYTVCGFDTTSNGCLSLTCSLNATPWHLPQPLAASALALVAATPATSPQPPPGPPTGVPVPSI